MITRRLATTIAILSAVSGFAWADGHVARQSHVYSAPSSSYGRVLVHTPEDQLEVVAWEKDEIRVQATKTATAPEDSKKSKARRLVGKIEIEVTRDGDQLEVAAVFPRACREDVECRVEFKISAPEGIEVATASQ